MIGWAGCLMKSRPPQDLSKNFGYLTLCDCNQPPVVERRIQLIEMKPRMLVEGRIETTTFNKDSLSSACWPRYGVGAQTDW